MSNAVLQLREIARIYRQGEKELRVLSGCDLQVRAGEAVALVGPSGSGKSTLLQIAGLLDAPSSGQVILNGEDMSAASDGARTLARRSHIGFVYQFHHLLPEFSARENVAMPPMIAGASASEAGKKADGLLQSLGLADRAHHRPARLSGGEQQRVALARALANDPQLLLADEPTGNLDPDTSAKVFAVLLESVRRKGLATLVATHNMELAKTMDRVVRLDKGILRHSPDSL